MQQREHKYNWGYIFSFVYFEGISVVYTYIESVLHSAALQSDVYPKHIM